MEELQVQQPQPHDTAYKELFYHTDALLELLQSFIRAPWVNDLKVEEIVRVDKEFVLQDFSKKAADMVYLLKTKGQKPAVILLLELQSKVDYRMPYRLLLYMIEIWRDFYNQADSNERDNQSFLFPAIVPVVLYSGKERWTVAEHFRHRQFFQECFESGELVDFHYHLIDINRYTVGELITIGNVVSCVFALDQAGALEEIVDRLHLLIGVIRNMTESQFHELTVWMERTIQPLVSKETGTRIRDLLQKANPKEAEEMVSHLGQALSEEFARKAKEGEQEKAREIARNMLRDGEPVEKVIRYTGLSQEEVQLLAEEVKEEETQNNK